MAKTNQIPLFSLSLLLLLLSLLSPTSAISEPELDAAIAALRSRGYNLFGNAITTSDVRLELLLSNASYTLFAPTDSTLFSLDMASAATAYVTALRYHVALGRLSLPYLRSLPDRSALRTLVPYSDILISRLELPGYDFVTVDGVDIVLPGLFYGQDVAVHGLDGILTLHRKRISARSPNLAPSSPDSRISSSISSAPSFSPLTSPEIPSFSPLTSPVSSHSPSISPVSSHSPSISPNTEPSPSISPISPVSSRSPSILPISKHSPSISPVSPVPSLPPSIAPESSFSPSIAPVLSLALSIAPESGHSPSIAPESGISHLGYANLPDLSSPVVSPAIYDTYHEELDFPEEHVGVSEISPAPASSDVALGISWNDCKEKSAVGCSQSRRFVYEMIEGLGGKIARQQAQHDAL